MITPARRGVALRAGLTLALVAACWPVWDIGGWLAEMLGLSALDLLVRVCVIFLFLSAAEAVLARVPAGLSRATHPVVN